MYMKRLFFTSVLLFVALMVNAQGIYTKVIKYDKFDDVVWEKNVKTLIEMTDSSIVIETKGQKPVEYMFIGNPPASEHKGSREEVVNLVGNVYGFQSDYVCVLPSFLKELVDKYGEIGKQSNGVGYDREKIEEDLTKRLKDFFVITFRTISKYSFEYAYETDMVWVSSQDGSRVIYTK